MKALVLERTRALRDIDCRRRSAPGDVRIKVHTVGVRQRRALRSRRHRPVSRRRADGARPRGIRHRRRDRRRRHPPARRRPRAWSRRAAPRFARDAARALQPRSRRALLGDAAHPRLPDAVRRASGRVHVPAARQRLVRRRRDRRAAVDRPAGREGGDEAGRPRGRDRRRHDRRDDGARRARRRRRARDLADVVPDKLALFAGNRAVTTVDAHAVARRRRGRSHRRLGRGRRVRGQRQRERVCGPRRPDVPGRLRGADRDAGRPGAARRSRCRRRRAASNRCSATRTSFHARSR